MTSIILYRFVDGPYEDEDGTWYNLCLVGEDDESVVISEVNFETLDDALSVKETLTTTLYVLEVDVGPCSTTILN